jgi:hypothetical protein
VSDPNDPNATMSGSDCRHLVLQWVVDNGPCGTTSDEVIILIFDGSCGPLRPVRTINRTAPRSVAM